MIIFPDFIKNSKKVCIFKNMIVISNISKRKLYFFYFKVNEKKEAIFYKSVEKIKILL